MTEHIYNRNYNVKVKILTPVHIGAGQEKNWIKGLDFIEQDGYVYPVDFNKLFTHIKISPDEVLGYFHQNNNISGLLQSKDISFSEIATGHKYPFKGRASSTLKVHITGGLNNTPIIPGSSIKGAVRSILLKHLGIEQQSGNEKKVIGSSEKGDDLMRFIHFTDASFDKFKLYQTKIFNLFKKNEMSTDWNGGWKHGKFSNKYFLERNGKVNNRFTTTYQTISIDGISTFRISFSEKIFNQYANRLNIIDKIREIITDNDPLTKLFWIINKYSSDYLEKEYNFFEKYKVRETDIILEEINRINEDIPEKDDKSCVLRLAQGSGFYSVTGDWRFNDHFITLDTPDKKNKTKRYPAGTHYKSRKLAFEEADGMIRFYPMGFIKLIIS